MEVCKGLVAFDKVAVEVVGLAAGGPGDRAFVVVGTEVTDRAHIAEAIGILKSGGESGQKAQIWGVGREVCLKEMDVRCGQNVFHVPIDDLYSRSRFAIRLHSVLRFPPEACGSLNDIHQDDKENGENRYGNKDFQQGKGGGFFRQN